MSNLKNKIVFITGASSGIGAACARHFAKAGVKLLLCARNITLLEDLAEQLSNNYGTRVHVFQLDVRDKKAVFQQIEKLPVEWQAIDILINNAGLARGLDTIQEGDTEHWDEMIDTNVKGLLYVTRAVLPGMVQRDRGHIINIGSIAGHEVYPKGAVYCASKFAVRAITQGLRVDLINTHVRVSSVDPGLVETNFASVRFSGDAERAEKLYGSREPLTADDVADAILYCAQCPPHVNAAELLLMPSDQASATVARRRE
jgi:3-hydroxy acid dehydrogenase/malonic semialdehyde reductase